MGSDRSSSRQPAKATGPLDWPRELLCLQSAVGNADEDLDHVLGMVLASALRLISGAEGGEIELIEHNRLMCRAAAGISAKRPGTSMPLIGDLPAFCAIAGGRPSHGSRQTGAGTAARPVASTISAPIAFENRQIGLIRVHARSNRAFGDNDLLALQLIAGFIVLALTRDAYGREERARAEADRRFKATFDQAAVGIAHVAPDGRFIMVNERFCAIAGHDREALIEGGFQAITHPEDLDADLAHVDDLIHGRSSSYSMEKRYLRADGKIAWINLTVSLIHKADGSPDFFVSVIEDISARRAAEIDAEHDPLTGLLNRRGALRRLDAVIGPEGLWSEGLAVAYLDLDGFKRINDLFGHREGDRCLIKVAAALRKSFRGDDMIARLGGDEFLAIVPAANELDLEELLDRLRANVAAAADNEEWTISASVGVIVVGPNRRVDAQTLVEAADGLMYRAKHANADRPVVSTLPAAA